MTDRNKPPQPSSTKLPRHADGSLKLDNDIRATTFLNTTCGALVTKDGDETYCGKRQFQSPSGPTCEDGHGGAPGRKLPSRGGGFECTKEDMEPHPDDQHAYDPNNLPPLGPGDVKVGDVVTLISGGPRMTAIGITPCYKTDNSKKPSTQTLISEWIECIWFAPTLDGAWTGPFKDTFDIRWLDSEV